MTNLAEMYHLSGRLPEAETLLRLVFVLLERIPGPEHPELALALNNLASQYQDHQRYSGGVFAGINRADLSSVQVVTLQLMGGLSTQARTFDEH